MILGTSADTKQMSLYRSFEEPYEQILVDWINGEDLADYTHDVYEYFYVKEVYEPFVDDNWHFGLEYSRKDYELLIECDYCGKRFTINTIHRQQKSTRYLGHFNGRTGKQKINKEMVDLYKDNCSDCKAEKIQETTMIRNGYFHPSETEEWRIARAKSYRNDVPTSRGQRYLAKILNAELNVLIDFYYADMVFDDKIVIEYDGGGHNLNVLMGRMTQEEFDKDEKKRTKYLNSKGYKVVRFVSPREFFPEDEQETKKLLCEAISQFYLSEVKEVKIAMPTSLKDKTYGKLRPIKEILEKSEWGQDIL